MLTSIIYLLSEAGFMPHAQDKTFFSDRPADKGRMLSGVTYLYRARDTRHQYASVISYEDRLCEVVIETFGAPRARDTKHLAASISRSVDELTERLAA